MQELVRSDADVLPSTLQAEVQRLSQALRDATQQLDALRGCGGRFAGRDHELKTPLNAIIGFTGTLLLQLPGPLTSEQERQLKIVQQSARQLLAVINALLAA